MADPVTRSTAKIAALVAVPVGLLAGVGVFLLLANVWHTPADTGPVTMAERELTAREELVCRALLSQVPEQVRDRGQRAVTDGPEQNTAYGDPPMTVECGVPAVQVAPTDQVWPLDGVCYHATEDDDASVWVTIDREVPVRVTVPNEYDGAGQWVAELSPTIVDTVLPGEQIPTGCRE